MHGVDILESQNKTNYSVFQNNRIEIKDQPFLKSGNAKIGEQLRLMKIRNSLECFYFDYDLVCDNNVGPISAVYTH